MISVVTVNFNQKEELENTTKSVVGQTYENIEFIVVDAASSDGSVDVIKKYENKIQKWKSEPDEGIYDGMNKGVDLATGEWIIFMNSGDIFSSEKIVKSVVDKMNNNADLVFGNWIVKYPQYNGVERYRKAGELKNLWKGMVFSHQTLFTRIHILKKNKFNYHSYKNGADYDFIMKAYYKGYKFQKINQTIAVVTAGGNSDVKRINSIQERLRILRKYDNNPVQLLYYFFLIFKSVIKINAKKLIPYSFLCKIYRKLNNKRCDV